MRHTIEARFFTADEREMVSFCLIGRSKDAVNTMTVNRFRKEHARLWREVAGDHAAWNGGKEANKADPVAVAVAVEQPKAEAPRKRARKGALN